VLHFYAVLLAENTLLCFNFTSYFCIFCSEIRQNLCINLQKRSSFWGTSSPRPPTGASPLDLTGRLSSPRPPVVEIQDLLICFRTAPWWYLWTRNLCVPVNSFNGHRRSTHHSEKAAKSWSYVLVSCDELSLSMLLTRCLLIRPAVLMFIVESVTFPGDNHYDDNVEVVPLSYCPYRFEANIIIRYYF